MSKTIAAPKADPYAQQQTIEIYYPTPFIHLCKMLKEDPKHMLTRFLEGIASEASVSNDFFGEPANVFFLSAVRHNRWFTFDLVRQMALELGVLMGLYSRLDIKEQKQYDQWKKMCGEYLKVWEKKWLSKRRKKPLPG